MSERRNQGLKTRERFSNTLRNDLVTGLEELHERTRIPKSKLLDEAVELLLKKHNKDNKDE